MWRVRFLRNATLSLLGVLWPGGRSHGFNVSAPSRSRSMTRPPMSSVNAAYESPRSMIEINGFRRPSMRRNICAMNVFPPPLDDMISMLASLRLESNGENGMSLRWRVSNRMPGECGVPRHCLRTPFAEARGELQRYAAVVLRKRRIGQHAVKSADLPLVQNLRVLQCIRVLDRELGDVVE